MNPPAKPGIPKWHRVTIITAAPRKPAISDLNLERLGALDRLEELEEPERLEEPGVLDRLEESEVLERLEESEVLERLREDCFCLSITAYDFYEWP